MLYFVGLPIGNLKDITLRALDVLGEVDIIACEDTRNTLKLLNHYKIKKRLVAYHKFNEQEMTQKIISWLEDGKNIAIVTDSGMPMISDPGNVLVNGLKDSKITYTVIPGATALISALVLSGKNSQSFCFFGFLPDKKSERTKLLTLTKLYPQTIIFYISPHSLMQDIADIFAIYGKRKASLVKEITKIYESVIDFVLGDSIDINTKGEFVLVVDGNADLEKPTIDENEQIQKFVDQGMSENQAISKVAKMIGKTKQELYKQLKVK